MNKYTLEGVNGNAHAIMGYVGQAMRKAGYTKSDVAVYQAAAKLGDYDNLLAVSMDMLDDVNRKLGL